MRNAFFVLCVSTIVVACSGAHLPSTSSDATNVAQTRPDATPGGRRTKHRHRPHGVVPTYMPIVIYVGADNPYGNPPGGQASTYATYVEQVPRSDSAIMNGDCMSGCQPLYYFDPH